MNRLKDLERQRMQLVAQISDTWACLTPDGRAAGVMTLSALYTSLVNALTDELRLAPELELGVHLVERIKHERELALTNAEYWRGSAIAWHDEETGAAVSVS